MRATPPAYGVASAGPRGRWDRRAPRPAARLWPVEVTQARGRRARGALRGPGARPAPTSPAGDGRRSRPLDPLDDRRPRRGGRGRAGRQPQPDRCCSRPIPVRSMRWPADRQRAEPPAPDGAVRRRRAVEAPGAAAHRRARPPGGVAARDHRGGPVGHGRRRCWRPPTLRATEPTRPATCASPSSAWASSAGASSTTRATSTCCSSARVTPPRSTAPVGRSSSSPPAASGSTSTCVPRVATARWCAASASYEAYWERWADPWERQALLKARPGGRRRRTSGSAGPRPPASVVWSAPFSADDLRQVRELKVRAEEEVRRRGLADREVKRGPGGIRDVEFSAQLLQLVHGRVDPELRTPSTLGALDALARGGYVDPDDADGPRRLATASCAASSTPSSSRTSARRTRCRPTATERRRLARVLGYRGQPDAGPDRAARPRPGACTAPRSARSTSGSGSGPSSPRWPAPVRCGRRRPSDRLEAFGFTDLERTRQAVAELTRGPHAVVADDAAAAAPAPRLAVGGARPRPRPARPAPARLRRGPLPARWPAPSASRPRWPATWPCSWGRAAAWATSWAPTPT